jgi:hypothetical protein
LATLEPLIQRLKNTTGFMTTNLTNSGNTNGDGSYEELSPAATKNSGTNHVQDSKIETLTQRPKARDTDGSTSNKKKIDDGTKSGHYLYGDGQLVGGWNRITAPDRESNG